MDVILELRRTLQDWNAIKQDYAKRNKQIELTTYNDYINKFKKLRDSIPRNTMMYNAINETVEQIKTEKEEVISPRVKRGGKSKQKKR